MHISLTSAVHSNLSSFMSFIDNTRKNYIWKWRTSIMRAFELMRWVDPEKQDVMIWAFISLVEKIPWENNDGITNLEVEQLLNICTWIWSFYMESDTESNLRNSLETHIGKLGEKEDIDSYFDRITAGISSKDKFSPFQKDG